VALVAASSVLPDFDTFDGRPPSSLVILSFPSVFATEVDDGAEVAAAAGAEDEEEAEEEAEAEAEEEDDCVCPTATTLMLLDLNASSMGSVDAKGGSGGSSPNLPRYNAAYTRYSAGIVR